MNPALEILLAVCGVVITIGEIVFRFGTDRGAVIEDLKRVDDEIDTLRHWRHDVENRQQAKYGAEYMLPELLKRIERLEARVFNGGPR